jgi:glutamate 5-kinase
MTLRFSSLRRVVIKIGSSSLTGPNAENLSSKAVDVLVDSVAQLRAQGCDVVIVSSGAIAAGIKPLGLSSRPRDLATQQAAAAVGQGLLIHRYTESLARYSLVGSQVLITTEDIVRRSHYRNVKQTLDRLLQLGVVPVINENDSVGTQEIRFGDNDRIAALISHLVGADLLLIITDVEGLYDAAPSDPSANLIREVDDLDSIAQVKFGANSRIGSGGMASKIEAARIASAAGIATVFTSLPNASEALNGGNVGTFFKALSKKQSSRLLWLAHASTIHGRLHIDGGAESALRNRGVSLLAAGVTKVSGDFVAGDAIEIVSPSGEVIARGLVSFDSSEIPQMLGRSTHELKDLFGPEFERELVHRDDLVIL